MTLSEVEAQVACNVKQIELTPFMFRHTIRPLSTYFYLFNCVYTYYR